LSKGVRKCGDFILSFSPNFPLMAFCFNWYIGTQYAVCVLGRLSLLITSKIWCLFCGLLCWILLCFWYFCTEKKTYKGREIFTEVLWRVHYPFVGLLITMAPWIMQNLKQMTYTLLEKQIGKKCEIQNMRNNQDLKGSTKSTWLLRNPLGMCDHYSILFVIHHVILSFAFKIWICLVKKGFLLYTVCDFHYIPVIVLEYWQVSNKFKEEGAISG